MKWQIMVAAALVGLGALGTVPRAAAANDVIVTLTGDRAQYYVGETIHLSLRIRNESKAAVESSCRLSPPDRELTLFVRRGARAFEALRTREPDPETARKSSEIRVVRAPTTVLAGGEAVSEAMWATEPGSKRLLLDPADSYEFYVACPAVIAHGGKLLLRSDVLRIGVSETPAEHHAALADYRASSLPLLQRAWPSAAPLAKGVLNDGLAFLGKYPNSPYSGSVRDALRRGLEGRVRSKEASTAEKEACERLQAEPSS
jgi:hypothetical protein